MDTKKCPLCGNSTTENEVLCRDCQVIAQKYDFGQFVKNTPKQQNRFAALESNQDDTFFNEYIDKLATDYHIVKKEPKDNCSTEEIIQSNPNLKSRDSVYEPELSAVEPCEDMPDADVRSSLSLDSFLPKDSIGETDGQDLSEDNVDNDCSPEIEDGYHEMWEEARESIVRRGKKRSYPILWVVSLLFLLVCGAFFYGYSRLHNKDSHNDAQLWKIAVSQNTPASYTTYLQVFPKGKYSHLAIKRIEVLRNQELIDWCYVVDNKSIENINSFLAKHPDTPLLAQAQTLLDSLAWVRADRKRTRLAYKDYLDGIEKGKYKGAYRSMALGRIAHSY